MVSDLHIDTKRFGIPVLEKTRSAVLPKTKSTVLPDSKFKMKKIKGMRRMSSMGENAFNKR
jgi:hypothetical protein